MCKVLTVIGVVGLCLAPPPSIARSCEDALVSVPGEFNGDILRKIGVAMAKQRGNRFEVYAQWEYFPRISTGWFRSKPDPRAKEIADRLRALGENFGQLLVDPALIQNRDAFFGFMAGHPEIHDPWEARRQFIASTPVVNIYRAMALTEESLDAVDRNGILSNARRNWGQMQPGILTTPNGFENGRRSALNSHESSESEARRLSPFISVSFSPEMAIAVAQAEQRRLVAEGSRERYKVYLFEIHMHEAELLNTAPDNGLWPASDMYREFAGKVVQITLPSGEHMVLIPGRKVESFAFSEIARSRFEWREVTEGDYRWTMIPKE